jgi:hypothetical protein
VALAVVPLAAANAVAAEVLDVELTSAQTSLEFVTACAPGCDLANFDPLYSAVSSGRQFASGDVPTGILRAFAAVPDATTTPTAVYASAAVSFVIGNPGGTDITLPAGWLSVTADASFTRDLGVGSSVGSFANFATFAYFLDELVDGAQPYAEQVALFGYTLLDYADWLPPYFEDVFIAGAGRLDPGSSMTYAFDEGAAQATITLGEVVIPVGDYMLFGWSTTVGAIASDGAVSVADSSRSTYASMVLPRDVTLRSDVPLQWVSTVPELPSWAGMSAGLLAVAGLGRAARRRRAAC